MPSARMLVVFLIVHGFRIVQSQTVCKPGHGGPLCNINCPDDCINCSDHAKCNRCKPGFYIGRQFDNASSPEVLDCSLKCRQNCISCSNFDTCNECKRGYYGNTCDYKCSEGCSVCESLDKCTACAKGFYSRNRRGKCYPCTHNCLSCRDSYYCSECKSGFYSYKCERECEIGCLGNNCDKFGHCTCKDNFRGYKCSGCVSGKYGKHCNLTCPNCICDKDTGQCVSCSSGYRFINYTCVICETGTWGPDCKNNCSEQCVECNPENGICTVCSDGKYGNDCSKVCSANCMTRNNIPVCAVENGTCLYGCKTLDKHGVFCTLACGSNCKGGSCEWTSGRCLNGCTMNYFGEFCDNTCSISCAPSSSRRCYSRNGTCMEGCIPGYYGTDCLLKCNANCLNNVCRRESGHCSHGCIHGYTGDTCTHTTDPAKLTDKNKTTSNTGSLIGAGIGGAAGMLLIGGGILLLVVYLRRRVRNKKRLKSTEPAGESNNDESAPVYTELTGTAAGSEPTGTYMVAYADAATYQNEPESGNVSQNAYEQLLDIDKSEQQYEMVPTTIYQNTSR